MKKPTTKIATNEVEISIVRLDDGREFRSSVKKMTRRHALNFQRTHEITPGTAYTVTHAVSGTGVNAGVIVRTIAVLEGGIFYAPGSVPADYN